MIRLKVLFICLTLGGFIHESNMAFLDVNAFFNVSGNLTKISWAHAVNSRYLLNQALNGPDMMLEADVVIGRLLGTNKTNIPIMAHPPETVSDLSLEIFLNDVLTYNTNLTSNRTRKGVKLDFKTIEAFESSVWNITNLYTRMNYPVWLNADILNGPINATTLPVNASRFFTSARVFFNSTLSVGWTTNYGVGRNGSYTNDQINAMVNTVAQNNIMNQVVTFPVRAGLAAQSIPQMQNLLRNITGSTITIWSSDGDPVNVPNLRNLIRTIGLNRTFIDVPTYLENQLQLNNLSIYFDNYFA